MTRLVLIHGRDAAGRDPDAMEARWLGALNAGLSAAGSSLLLTDDDATFVYYGDTLATLSEEQPGKPPPVTVHALDAGVPTTRRLSIPEARFALAVAREVLATGSVASALGPDDAADVHPEGALGDALATALTRALAAIDQHVPGLSGAVVLLATHDVYTYLHDDAVRSTIDAGLVDALATDEPAVVVAHSLGSLVAYSVLAEAGTTWDVPLLLTLGAPLGIRAVRTELQAAGPLAFPPGVDRWVNARDPRDLLALGDLTPQRFPLPDGSPAIEALPVANRAPWHHAAAVLDDGAWAGYLATRGVGAEVADQLAAR